MRFERFLRPFMVSAGLAAIAGLIHCGSDSSGSGDFGGGLQDSGVGTGGFSGFGGGGGAVADAAIEAPPPPPEKELESAFRSPVATSRFVWSANPDSGRVALVDAISLEVKIEEAGFGPTHLAAVPVPNDPNANVAIVLNVKSHDATLFRVSAGGAITKQSFETHEGANAWAVSPKGRWAVAWSNSSQVKDPDPTQGFQDVTVLSLESGKESSTRLSVGYRPTSIAFDASETHAFAVTEPGISVLALPAGGAPSVDALIEVSDDPLENPASRDVTFTPDGSFALVRRDGSPDVAFVDLATGQRTTQTLSGPVTDLDLSDDGKLAVAVVREKSELHVLPIPAAISDAAAIDTKAISGELFGSVALSADATVALLYTNAVPNDHLTIVNLVPGADYLAHRTVALKSPVQAVFPADDAKHAVVLQSTGAGSSKAGAFSVVPTAAALSPKIIGTDAPPTAVALRPAPEADRAIVTVRDDAKKIHGAYLARLPNLQVDYLKLASPPIATGIVPLAGRGYIAQQHPEGRITFVDLATGSAKTLTGFELGAKVVD